MGIGGKGVDFFVTIVVFTVLCTLALCLRWRAARLQGRRFQVDDGLLIFAWIAILAYEGTAIWTVFNDLGKPQAELTADDWVIVYKDFVAAMVCWTLATVLVKLAILFLYMRIFSTRSFRRWAIALITGVILFGVIYFPIAMTTCIPLSQLWHPVADGHCRDLIAQEIGSMAPNLFLDACIIALPMPWLWSLHMPLRNKLWITVMFSLGGINLGIMCYRLYAAIYPGPDASYDNVTQGIFSFLELWIGVIVACMPTMAPIFVNYVLPLATSIHSKLFGSGSSSSGGSLKAGRKRAAAAAADPAVNTFHRHNLEGHKMHRPQQQQQHSHHEKLPSVDDSTTVAVSTYDRDIYDRDDPYGRGDSGELHLVGPLPNAHLQTDCAMGQDGTPQNQNGIYVQQNFHTQWNNV